MIIFKNVKLFWYINKMCYRVWQRAMILFAQEQICALIRDQKHGVGI